MLLGIDIGTSATKALALRPDGAVLASASHEYAVSHPGPGCSEQDPAVWWDAAESVVRQILSADGVEPGLVQGIGVSGQMHGSVFLDAGAVAAAGTAPIGAIRPALLWNDQRTSDQCAAIERAAGGREATIRAVGNAALPGFTLPTLLWLRDHEPSAFARLALLVNPKDFITLQMTGAAATDVGDASGTLLFDPAARAWSAPMLDAVGVDRGLLAPVHESAAPIGALTPWAAERLGLRPGIPVVAGSGDNQCGAVGAGVVRPGMIGATLGTSGVLYAHADEPRLELSEACADGVQGSAPGRVHTMCAAAGPGAWCNTGCTLSAAGALQWTRDTIAPGADFESLMEEAARIPAGCEGLLFMPHLTGERCPYPDPEARAAWIGLTSRHTRAHMIRAVLEGVALTMGQILDILRSLPVPADHARVGGGGARSALWRQMLADVLGVPVSTPTTEEGPAFGAALLAGVGVGIWPSVPQACAETIQVKETITPYRDAEAYAAIKGAHASMYAQLRPTFRALAASSSAESH